MVRNAAASFISYNEAMNLVQNINISTYKNLLFFMRSISSNFTRLPKGAWKFLSFMSHKQIPSHFSAIRDETTHQHLHRDQAGAPTKLLGPVSLTAGYEITDYLAD